MDDIHVKVREAVLPQEIDDLLIVAGAPLDELWQDPAGIEQHYEEFLAVLTREFAHFGKDVFRGSQTVPVQDTPDKCSPESLGAVGTLALHLIYGR